MQRIVSYTLNDNGTYTAVVEGLSLGDDETLMINSGVPVGVDVRVYNPYRITDKQRRKIFALVNDIEASTGQPREYMRHMFQAYVQYVNGHDEQISLADCSKAVASEVIDTILEWVFSNDIPLNYKTSDLMKEDNQFIYLATIHRKCVICGTPRADLAHREAVGSGRNRRKVNHYGHHVLALCRSHHTEQHQMGLDGFDSKYILRNSWVKVDEKLNKMLQGK